MRWKCHCTHDEWQSRAASISWTPQSLVDQCLTCQIVAKIMEDDSDQVKELKKFYTVVKIGENDLESLLRLNCICRIDKYLTLKRNEPAGTFKTSALWINCQLMVRISRTLVAADRMGSWETHLCAISARLYL